MPRERGGGRLSILDIRNIEYMCQACNGFRARLNHCWGAVACVKAIADAMRCSHEQVISDWEKTKPVKFVQVIVTPEEKARRKASEDAVKIGRIVDRVGIHEFVYPVDTAAKCVWNLATLAMGSVNKKYKVELSRRLTLDDAERRLNYR